MEISNQVVLRPRFQMELDNRCTNVLERFASAKTQQSRFKISCVDHHVFIRLPREEQLFWSSQLHLEISESPENTCTLHGFFGPNPTVWTMFIFFHVVVGTLFLANLVWLYSDASLGVSIGIQLSIAIGLVVVWGLLYIAGSIGKKKGKPGMHALYKFMLETLELPPISNKEGTTPKRNENAIA